MSCLNLAACVTPGASLVGAEGVAGSTRYAESERAQRFAELLGSSPSGGNIYSPVSDLSGPSGSMAANVMSSIQTLDLPTAAVQAAAEAARAADGDLNSLMQFLVQFQMEHLRSHMMFEVMSTAKQGVSTLFQQQG